MYKTPLVIGVRQFANWDQAPSVKETLLGLGQNTGNMMFTQALLRVIAGAKWGSFALTEHELEGRDAIVLAAANWVNSFDDFGWLADRLEKTALPVFLIGVGAQSSLAMEVPNVKPGTLRLLQLVRDRSVSIAARGVFSCEVLSKYGIKNVVSAGCPSMLLVGPMGPSISPPEHVSYDSCCIHSTRHGFNRADRFHSFLYRQAFEKDIDIILQSETADIYFALGKEKSHSVQERASEVVKAAYGSDDIDAVNTYLLRRGHVFPNFESWIAFMKTKAFCFGTRIHGTVASIIAGTPATLIVHDSRTLEMANSMSIPFVLSTDMSLDAALNTQELVQPAQIQQLNNKYTSYRSRYVDYLKTNVLCPSAMYAAPLESVVQ